MRGQNDKQQWLLTPITPEHCVPKDHPIRAIKVMVDAELTRLSPLFEKMYSRRGRPSIPPERLLKSCLLIALFSVRSERQFCEQLKYNLLFKWFLDMQIKDEPFDASVFAHNKERLLQHDVARVFFDGIVAQARDGALLSSDHFTVDGTLIEAWASLKSFRPKGEVREESDDPGNPTVNFHGERRRNDTHESTTDPEARLVRKGAGKEAKLAFGTHVLMENRTGLCLDITTSIATGRSEREAALTMLERQRKRGVKPKSLGADKGYDVKEFVAALRAEGVTPHVASKKRGSAVDNRTTRHESYKQSQKVRKRVEEIFGWMKTVGGFRKTRYKGVERTGLWACFVGAAYNLLRMAKLMPVPT